MIHGRCRIEMAATPTSFDGNSRNTDLVSQPKHDFVCWNFPTKIDESSQSMANSRWCFPEKYRNGESQLFKGRTWRSHMLQISAKRS
jgi:hypothetical protein